MVKKHRYLLLIIVWWGVISLFATTIRNYHVGEYPPLWDNLAYQNGGLNIAQAFLDSDWNLLTKLLWVRSPIAYTVSLALSFLLFGFNQFSPYVVSIVFGVSCLVICYYLAIQLGARKGVAFIGIIFVSLLPNFIYQNCLQTRNDFPLAFFISLSWYLLLGAFICQDQYKAFIGGILAGIGTLIKLSAPGYLIWGLVMLLFFPVSKMKVAFVTKVKYILYFTLGAVLSCGWFYLSNLSAILRYYGTWAKNIEQVAIQYGLHSPLDWRIFYIKNLIYSHLTPFYARIGGILLISCISYRIITQRTKWILNIQEWLRHSPFLVTFFGSITAIAFLTFNRSISSLGDVPVFMLFIASIIAFISQIAPKIRSSLLMKLCIGFISITGLIYSMAHLPLYKPQAGQDFLYFSQQIEEFFDSYALPPVPFMQVFSHPVYNANTVEWQWKMKKTYPINMLLEPKLLIKEKSSKKNLPIPKELEGFVEGLSAYPLLILSEYNAIEIGGEPFHPFNRFHAEIKRALIQQKQFIQMKTISIKNGNFPLHFYMNKNFAAFSANEITADAWLEWGSTIRFVAFKPVKVRWIGIPIRQIQKFSIISKDLEQSVSFHLVQVLPDGRYEYESETFSPQTEPVIFKLTAETKHLIVASPQDPRKLAFRKVTTEIVFPE